MIAGHARRQLVEEPQALLRERERRRACARNRLDRRGNNSASGLAQKRDDLGFAGGELGAQFWGERALGRAVAQLIALEPEPDFAPA
jgi:hypothetical protein